MEPKVIVWAVIVISTIICGCALWKFFEYLGDAIFPGGNAMAEGDSLFECECD